MRIIDLRSDTVTQPTDEMRRAMAEAVVGDDVYGDDPTVNKLETLAAEILHKEAALFVPSGTFGNQLALLTHCKRGDEVILDDDCHILQHEAGAPGIISGVNLRAVECDNGYMPLRAIETRIRQIGDDIDDLHSPRTGLICLENAHGSGTVLPLDYMREVKKLADRYNVPVHVDGARIFNAAEHLKIPPHELADTADSVMFCLSKGLCAPVGSILAGNAEFVRRARKNRKLMGGGLRQAGVLAAAGLISLGDTMRRNISQDHKLARKLCKWLGETGYVTVRPDNVHINMVFCGIEIINPLTAEQFTARMNAAGILINAPGDGHMRLVTHYGITENDLKYTVETIYGILTRDYW